MTTADVDLLVKVQRRSFAGAGPGLLGSWPPEQAMEGDQFTDFLNRLVYGVLATARSDGRAHAAPVAFSVERGAFWVASVEGARLRHLRATPWASLVVFEGQRNGVHRALTAEGGVRLYEGADFAAVRARLDEQWVSRHGHPPDWATAFIELRPERVFSHASARA